MLISVMQSAFRVIVGCAVGPEIVKVHVVTALAEEVIPKARHAVASKIKLLL